MEKIVVLIILSGVGLVVFKLRGDAARSRKEVMARLATEREQRGGVDYSPTAELFREVGVRHDPAAPLPPTLHLPDLPDLPPPPADAVPVADDLLDPTVEAPVPAPVMAAAAPPAPASTEIAVEPAKADVPSDLRSLFKGIAMPAGLRPLGPLAPGNASFVTAAEPSVVHAGLEAEFERLECEALWIEPTVVQTSRNGMKGLVTIYSNPAAATDTDGRPLYPGVEPGQVVVRMLAL